MSFISEWLTLISSRKTVKIKIKKTCKNILNCKRDMKFVYICLNHSSDNLIVSEDHHFVNNGDKLLKKGIRLLSIDEALRMI